MRILLVRAQPPFAETSSTTGMRRLEEELRQRGHLADCLRLPFSEESTETIFDQALTLRLVSLEEHADRIVAFGPPAHLIRHPVKVVWATRAFLAPLPGVAAGRAEIQRQRVERMDLKGYREAHQVFAATEGIGQELAIRAGIWAGLLAQPEADSAEGWEAVIRGLLS